jgi:hypothetical protein
MSQSTVDTSLVPADETENPIRSKTEFVESIRNWVILDKQLKIVNEKSKELRSKKSAIGDRICEFMEDQNIADKPIKINDQGQSRDQGQGRDQGQIQMVEKKDYSPLTFSYIEERLAEIIEDEDQVDFIINYLRDHREINVYSDLKIVYPRSSSRSSGRNR